MLPDTAPVRHGEELDAARLSAWLRSQLPDAGNDLTTANLPPLVAALPNLVEVSIGHAVIADALTYGMAETVRRFRHAINDR